MDCVDGPAYSLDIKFAILFIDYSKIQVRRRCAGESTDDGATLLQVLDDAIHWLRLRIEVRR